jgi:hypothetical protein
MIASLMLSACSDDNEPNTMAWDPSIVSSSFSSNAAHSETNRQVSSSSTEDFLEQRKFSNYLSQFVSPGENSINFDSHVVAFNAGGFSNKCEEAVVRYDVDGNVIPLSSFSEELFAECFPKTAPLLSKKFSLEMKTVKFYAVIMDMADDPTFAVLSRFATDEIYFNVVYPGGVCILATWGPRIIYLVADTEGFVQEEDIPIAGKIVQSEIWKCNESWSGLPNVKIGGEWYNDSLL